MTTQIDYQLSLGIGISKGLSAVVVGHPLDVLKTQCELKQISPFPAVKSLFAEKGFRGFYSGITLNGSRIVLKESFRPLLLQFFQKLSSQNLSPLYQNTLYEQACIGLGIATVEMLYCPLEKLKVDFITNSAIRNSYINFYQRYKGRLFQVAFQGVIPMYAQKVFSWVGFLVSDSQVRNIEKETTQTDQLSFYSKIKVSFFVGVINTLVYMPPDTIKTHLQKHNSLSNESLFHTVTSVYKKNGWRGFYMGWQVRLIHYMMQSVYFSYL